MRKLLMQIASLWRQVGPRATDRRSLVAGLTRLPGRREAAQVISGTPCIGLENLAALAGVENVTLNADPRVRHPWALPAVESEALALLLNYVRASRVFEIGTFDGGTTALLADRGGSDCTVFTLDLPDDEFDATQTPPNFDSTMIGHLYRDSPSVDNIVQLRGNSHTFDYTAWLASIDLVFVDAGHDWDSGIADTRAALRIVRPGGVIVWDDFDSHWSGLVLAIARETRGLELTRILGTRLVFARTPSS